MENKTNDEKAKRRVHTRTNITPGTWYFAKYLVVLCVVLKKTLGSAPQGC